MVLLSAASPPPPPARQFSDAAHAKAAAVRVLSTQRFCVLECGESFSGGANKEDLKHELPVMDLEDLLLHSRQGTTMTVQTQLKDALAKHGFVLLTVTHVKAASVIRDLRESLRTEIFPAGSSASATNAGNLQTSAITYVSEKGVPMYKLGYELCEDGVREVFRVAAESPETVEWPVGTARSTWMRGLGLMRHVTDTALDLLLLPLQAAGGSPKHDNKRRMRRPHSKSCTWLKDDNNGAQQERPGDFSVLYAMHYFERAEMEPGVIVKEHVDPSLLVIEPFLFPDTAGLQVWDRIRDEWMDCDGPTSPILWAGFEGEVMLIFAGKALTAVLPDIEPTLHRVVTVGQPRCTVIYEQKYAEFYPTPTFD